jgi:D-alanyl-D-alanine carboxypeptidase (penicillin-binding protein 5/6)
LLEGATGQVIAALDGDRRRPIASAIKLVTALAVIDALPAGSVVVVGEEVRGIEGSTYGLRPGDVRTVEDLLSGLLLRSGNDAAVALAHAVAGSEDAFTLHMRDVLQLLGIDATPASASGLEPGDALSAAELALVSRAALAEPRIRELVGRVELRSGTGEVIENRNLFVGQFTGATGLKTGFTNAAGYTLSASARRDGRELIAVVLGATDDAARRISAAGLLEYGFSVTEVRSVGHSVTLRTSRGPVRFGTEGVRVTVENGTDVMTMWPVLLRPDDTPTGVEVRVGGHPSGRAEVTRRDGREERDTQGLGAALVDGVYAALRPLGLEEALR